MIEIHQQMQAALCCTLTCPVSGPRFSPCIRCTGSSCSSSCERGVLLSVRLHGHTSYTRVRMAPTPSACRADDAWGRRLSSGRSRCLEVQLFAQQEYTIKSPGSNDAGGSRLGEVVNALNIGTGFGRSPEFPDSSFANWR